jgi:hypothetical protein
MTKQSNPQAVRRKKQLMLRLTPFEKAHRVRMRVVEVASRDVRGVTEGHQF